MSLRACAYKHIDPNLTKDTCHLCRLVVENPKYREAFQEDSQPTEGQPEAKPKLPRGVTNLPRKAGACGSCGKKKI